MIPLWLDCDPGHEDALALLLACALPHFELIGVSTVFGNAGLDATTNNALALLTAFHHHHHTAVFPGAEKPLSGSIHTSTSLHGRSGLDGTALLPMPLSQRQPDHTAVPAIVEAIDVGGGELVIVATGPLTNIASVVVQYPHVLDKIRYISIMGGSVDPNQGNCTKFAEFNIWSDVTAAQTVFSSPQLAGKLVLVPLDLSNKVLATPEVLRCVQHGPQFDKYTVFRQMMYELLAYLASAGKHKYGYTSGPPAHDPLAVAVLLALYKQVDLGLDGYNADVLVANSPRGQTQITKSEHGSVFVASKINPDAIWELVYNSIAILEGS